MGADKKELSPEWITKTIDMMIGPNLAILMARDARKANQLIAIMTGAVIELHDKEGFENTNAWVVAACNRIGELYNTFMTATLIDQYDNGVPDKPSLIVVSGGGDFDN